MPNEPAIFKDVKDLERVLAATKWVERQFNAHQLVNTPVSSPTDTGMPKAMVEIIDPQPGGYPTSGGYYLGKFLTLSDIDDLTADPYSYMFDADDFQVVVFELNGGDLEPGVLYDVTVAQFYTESDGTGALSIAYVDAGGSGGITVSEGTCINIAAAGDDRQISVDVPCVQAALTFDVEIDVPSCITVVLIPTYAATLLGGEQVWTGATAQVFVKNRTVTMLAGTEITALPDDCEAMAECCPTVWYCLDGECVEQAATDPPPDGYTGGPYAAEEDCDADDCNPAVAATSCCPSGGFKENMTLTISGTGGGSFPITWDGTSSGANAANWDTGLVSLTGAGAGTLTLRGYCFGGTVLQNNSGTPDYTVTFSGVYTTNTCSPFVVETTGTLVGGGAYNGEVRTFTWTV